MELLAQRELSHIFTENQYKSYKRKVTSGNKDVNEYLAALSILDMFIVNTVC